MRSLRGVSGSGWDGHPRIAVDAQVAGQRIAGMDLQRRIQRKLAGRGTEEAKAARVGRVVGNGEAKDQWLTGRQCGAVLVVEREHAVDQLSVTAVLDAGQMR